MCANTYIYKLKLVSIRPPECCQLRWRSALANTAHGLKSAPGMDTRQGLWPTRPAEDNLVMFTESSPTDKGNRASSD